MGDRPDAAKEVVDGLVAGDKRVAAGDEHVADRWVAGDIGDAAIDDAAVEVEPILLVAAFTKAVAAVDRTELSYAKSDAVRVNLDDFFNRGVRHLVQGVLDANADI